MKILRFKNQVFTKDLEGNIVPCPAGDYELSNGIILNVDCEGMKKSIIKIIVLSIRKFLGV
tara:strand:- start:347 stop:529 length:183 start_codon:yes stop_codon:yes gene_type:complete